MRKIKVFARFVRIKAKAFYRRHERFFPVGFFLSGFLYDSITLSRIDRLSDNLVLLAYIILAGMLILLIGLMETGQVNNKKILRYKKWYPNILQFMLGNLFSAYVIFYFKSASIHKSMIFVGLLVLLLLLNEFLHHRLVNITFLCTIYFFAVFAFLSFFLPVITHTLSAAMFFSSGAIAFLLTSLIVSLIYRRVFRQYPQRLVKTASPILSVFAVMAFLYWTNWIPPVPLSLKSGGIYHHVQKTNGTYELRFWRPHRYQVWVTSDKNFRYSQADTVFCFTSVFAPFDLRARIVHHWQTYDPRRKKYISTDKLSYRISGGRAGGYRGYTYKRNAKPGRWRVDVETPKGQVLGRIDFRIEPAEGPKGKEIVVRK